MFESTGSKFSSTDSPCLLKTELLDILLLFIQLHCSSARSKDNVNFISTNNFFAALWSKVRHFFDRSNTGIVGSHPTQGMDVFLRSFLMVRFAVLTAVVKKSIFWDITPCSPL
jgi:hypothetical protein